MRRQTRIGLGTGILVMTASIAQAATGAQEWVQHRSKSGFTVAHPREEEIEEHRAATRAVAEIVGRGRFVITSAETFRFRWHFRTPAGARCLPRDALGYDRAPACRRLEAVLRKDPSAPLVVEDVFHLNVLTKA